jgi:hypothetical protein
MLSSIDALQIAGVIFAIIFGTAAFVGLIAGALYIVRSRKITVNNQLADSAIASLQASLAAANSRLDIVESDNEHCIEMKNQQDLVIAQLRGSVDELRSWVTARDLIRDLSVMTRNGFIALKVDATLLESAHADPPVVHTEALGGSG